MQPAAPMQPHGHAAAGELHDLRPQVPRVALQRLALAAPAVKKQFLDASVVCVLDDGYLAIEEAELLRLFAVILEVPLPPLIEPRAA